MNVVKPVKHLTYLSMMLYMTFSKAQMCRLLEHDRSQVNVFEHGASSGQASLLKACMAALVVQVCLLGTWWPSG
jgi:hypothetical protein